MTDASSQPAIMRSSLVRSASPEWDTEIEHMMIDAGLIVVVLITLTLCKLWALHRQPKGCQAAATPRRCRDKDGGAAIAKQLPPWRQAATKQKDVKSEGRPWRQAAADHNDPMLLARSILSGSDRNSQRSSVVDIYQRCRYRVEWSSFTPEETEQIFFSVCLAAARLGKIDFVEGVICDMRKRHIPRTQDLYGSLFKMFSAKRQFVDVVRLATFMRDDRIEVSDRAIWSCLCFAAGEEKAWDAVIFFFKRLRAVGEPTTKDFANAVRAALATGGLDLAISLTKDMAQYELVPDVYLFNNVFAACCAGGRHLEHALNLLETIGIKAGAVDGITWNTLIKGYTQAHRLDEAFLIVQKMEEEGFLANAVTFGTLLDACVSSGDMDRASVVFKSLVSSGCDMNTILFTTLMKGFARKGRVEEAMQVFQDMLSQGVEPDIITYSTLLKALCDAKELERAFAFFDSMIEGGVAPDEVVFNCLLNGCVIAKNLPLGERLLCDMVKCGIMPPIASISTMLKLYTECEQLQQAMELLRTMESRFGVASQQRLYVQVMQATLRMRKCSFTFEVFKEMIESVGMPSDEEISKLLRVCVNFNLLKAGLILVELALDKGFQRIRSEHLQGLLDAAVRKHQEAVVRGLVELAKKYTIPIQSAGV